MPDYASSLAAFVDGRIDAAAGRNTHMGTVASRSTTGAYAEVIFDGTSGVPAPVKCFEHVLLAPGDRVGMVKFGSDWVIVGNYSIRALANVFNQYLFGTLTQITGTTFQDMDSSPGLTYTKMRDATIMRYTMGVSGACTTPPNIWRMGFHVSSADGVTSYDQEVGYHKLDVTTRQHFLRARMASSAHAAGVYSIVARWTKISGSGFIQTDSADSVEMWAEEIVI